MIVEREHLKSSIVLREERADAPLDIHFFIPGRDEDCDAWKMCRLAVPLYSSPKEQIRQSNEEQNGEK